jgi:hypothetical protein
MYRDALDHVQVTGHTCLFCADDLIRRLVGILCNECETYWTAPLPGPGQFMDWPHNWPNEDTSVHFNSSQARNEYLTNLTTLGKTDHIAADEGPSVWDQIRNRKGVGW